MSQHTIDAIAPATMAVVGYDPRLKNFFAHVYGSEGPIEWIPSMQSTEDLKVALAPHAIIEPNVEAQLIAEQERPHDFPPIHAVDHRHHPGHDARSADTD